MENFTIVLIAVFTATAATFFTVWFFSRQMKKGVQAPEQGLLLLQKELQHLAQTMDQKLGESSRQMTASVQTQFSESQKLVRNVTESLTKLDETNKQVIGFADQLQSLQDVLQNPKRRGVLGEYYLETVLKNVLPPAVYKMQYSLGEGDDGRELIVDAAIFVQDKIIPIDSKFSLENYNRLIEERRPEEAERVQKSFKQDLKNRIDETAKYIRPQKGTMDFALMFIPSEAIFYDLLINQVGATKINTEDLIQYAAKRKVNIVSPNSFYAFLQTILHGLKQMEIEKSTHDIIKKVDQLSRHIKSHEGFMAKLGNSLKTTVNHYTTAHKEFAKIDKDVFRITGKSAEIEPIVIEKPNLEED